MTNAELADQLERWAANRDKCNRKPGRHGKPLKSDLLRLAAERLRVVAARTTYYRCEDCREVFTADNLGWIKHLTERVGPGEPMPAGECPSCGAVCHATEDRCLARLVYERTVPPRHDSIEPTGQEAEVDITAWVVRMGKDAAYALEDDSYPTDDLVPPELLEDHDGPFALRVYYAVRAFYER